MSQSTAWLAMIFARWSKERQPVLLQIEHPMLDATIRIANRTDVPIVSGGETFVPWPFVLTLPNDSAAGPSARLRTLNVDRSLGFKLRALREPPTCTFFLVLASSPGTIEFEFAGFELAPITVKDVWIEGDLTRDDISNRPYPRQRITPQLVPSWFQL